MKCCNNERDSRFCCDCGKQLIPTTPLEEIKTHIRNNASRYEKMVEVRGGASWERAAKKWRRWSDCMINVADVVKVL